MGVGFIFITPRSSQVLTRAKTITIPTTFSAAVYKFFRNFVTFLMAEGAGGGSSSNWVGLQSFIFAKRIATGRINCWIMFRDQSGGFVTSGRLLYLR